MWIIVAVGVVVVAIILMVAKTAGMNSDPLQQELAGRMLGALAESRLPRPSSQRLVKHEDGTTTLEPPAPQDIVEGWADVKRWLVAATPHKSPGQRQTMVAHALSMMKPHLDEWDYDLFRRFGRIWDGYS